MHIGLNLIYLVPGETGGMETYARELIPALLRERSEVRLTAFVNREASEDASDAPWGELVPAVAVPVRARNRWQWVRGEQQLLPRLAAKAGVDVLHSLGSTAPGWGRFRRVVTIHDLIYRIYPEAHHGLRARAMSVLVPLAARRSDRIIAPSASTKDDLVRLLGISPELVDLAPHGLGVVPAESAGETEVRGRFDLGARVVVLTASAKRPHKNLAGLLDAWARLPAQDRPVLVLPGYPTQHEAQLRAHAAALGLEADTRFTGWVEPRYLEGLYRVASCFVFPSFYEGFGFPVLEAMARGVPVACSDRASLPEIAGDAVRYFDPEDPGAIADAVQDVLGDAAAAERLRVAGLERACRFTWSATARATLESYERALASSS